MLWEPNIRRASAYRIWRSVLNGMKAKNLRCNPKVAFWLYLAIRV